MAIILKLRRSAASDYLLNQHGIGRKPSTLAKLAVVGGGPRFQHDGRTPLYPTDELDQWAEAQLSPIKSSTSDGGEVSDV